ncbi:MAG: ABC transporter ATP-binding protein, partial [Campylobacter sp.]|nr:ABC transporter ATP-binding protein [Campylobacter sp.]
MGDLTIENLKFSYGESVVFENLNLNYFIKDFLAIVGPNGGGKSTILKLILGLLKPKAGSVKIYGKSPNLQKIGYVPQYIASSKSFPISVLEVVLSGLIDKKMFGFYSGSDKKIALEKLALVGMSEFANSRISELSGGQRQRVYIARALCGESKILLLDEPTASIDTMGQVQIFELLKELNLGGIGIIMVSHEINLALSYATKAAYVANKELIMHDISKAKTQNFLHHLEHNHKHFCDIELALKECGCGGCLHGKDGDFSKECEFCEKKEKAVKFTNSQIFQNSSQIRFFKG